MKETEYAFAVAKIRARESDLFTKADFEALILSKSYNAAKAYLESKGYGDNFEYCNLNNILNQKLNDVWNLVYEIAPDKDVFNFLIVKNDFHNMKAAIKAKVSGLTDFNSYLTPCTVSYDMVKDAVYNKKFYILPEFLRESAVYVYDVLVRTFNSLIAESISDAKALNCMLDFAYKTKEPFIILLAERIALCENIKIAYRMCRTKRDKRILQEALCNSREINVKELIESTETGVEGLLKYLNTNGHDEASKMLSISINAYEKWVDELLLKLTYSVRNKIFGPEPVIAYYMAKETEFLNIRVILTCKHNDIKEETIREMVRYV